MRARGLVPTTHVLTQALRPAGCVASRLGVARETPVVAVERLRLANGEPIAVEYAHLVAARCPNLEHADLEHGSLYDVLRSRFGLVLARAEQTIEAALPTARLRALLGVGPLDPVLRIERITYLDDGSPLEFVAATYRGDRYRLQVELRP
jgi:GntR family transcriptional regulator